MDTTETEYNDRMSAHSSEDVDGIGSGSVPLGDEHFPSASYVDQRSRLEHKIEKIREKITRNSIAREGDIERYLRTFENAMNGSDGENAQTLRMRQHFERKNKKYSQEAEQLQKKLEDYEQRLIELENGGGDASRSTHHKNVLHNVGHGITKTGSSLKGMAGHVINAPLDIAQKVRRGVFGSADNIANISSTDGVEPKSNEVGKSTFYEDSSTIANEREHQQESFVTDQPAARQTHSNELETRFAPSSETVRIDNQQVKSFLHEMSILQQQYEKLQANMERNKREAENEIKSQRNELFDARFKIQQLEQTLNETMELHQMEVKQLKSDLTLIGTRMEYQYNDRFKKIEESVESAANRMYRMETNWHENSERLVGATGKMWNSVLLSGLNIVVELIKLVLFVSAVVLDTLKPFTKTRQRSGIVICFLAVIFITWSVFDIGDRLAALLPSAMRDEAKTQQR